MKTTILMTRTFLGMQTLLLQETTTASSEEK